MQVILAGSFSADLDAIADFIRPGSPERAVTFVREIRKVCTSLIVEFPQVGRERPNFGADMYSFATHGRTIFYTYEPHLDRLKFHRVIGRQDVSHQSFDR